MAQKEGGTNNMLNQTLSEKVREVINMCNSINSKVSSKANSIEKEICDLNENISALTNMYVQREIAGDVDGMNKVKKCIDEAIQSKEALKFRKDAYKNATVKNKALQDELPQVLDLARETQEERFKSIEENQKLEDKLNGDIKELEAQIEETKKIRFNLINKSEARELRPLLQHIEKRKLKTLCEEPYLQSLISQGINATVDQYIETSVVNGRPGPQDICTNVRNHY